MHQPRGGVSRYFVELVREFRDGSGPRCARSTSTGARRATSTPWPPASVGRRLVGDDGCVACSSRLPSVPPRPRTSTTRPGTTRIACPDQARAADGRHRRRHDPGAAARTSSPSAQPASRQGGASSRRRTAVLCISESTRRDLLRLYGPLDAAVEVVPPRGRPQNSGPASAPGQPLPDDYLLFVGNRGGYKDFAVALEAFADASGPNTRRLSLVAVGGGPFTTDESWPIAPGGLGGRGSSSVDATDDELPGALRAPLGRSCSRRATRASACRHSRRWPAGRRSCSPTRRRIPEVGGDGGPLLPARRRRRAWRRSSLRLLGDDELAAGIGRAAVSSGRPVHLAPHGRSDCGDVYAGGTGRVAGGRHDQRSRPLATTACARRRRPRACRAGRHRVRAAVASRARCERSRRRRSRSWPDPHAG